MSQFGISASNSEARISERWVDSVQLSPALSVLHWQRVRKWVFWGRVLRNFCAVCGLFVNGLTAQLSSAMLQRAQSDLERIRARVADGILPRASLEQAERKLADAQDEETLSETLYSTIRLQDLTPEQADNMLAAASRRVGREQDLLESRQKLLDMGVISQSELGSVRSELYARQLTLELARDRAKLLNDLRQMAAEEQKTQLPTLQNSMLRYPGTGAFQLSDLPEIEKSFKLQFHHALPVSAMGQTPVHQSMGLDHRNKVDVALNPEQPEGLWLRHYLEWRHLPYLAFRGAVAGAATAAHIHIGTESTRLASIRK
jgi:hypothetical protein